MTTGMLADDEGLLTKQDAADLLQVAVDAASLAAERHWAALSGDQPTGALPESRRPTMVDRKPPGRIPKPEPLATCSLRGAVLITQESAGQAPRIHPWHGSRSPRPTARHARQS
jgi:hypothetical protein